MMALDVLVLRPLRMVGFSLYFLWRLALANARVAWEVLTPRHGMTAGIIEVPTGARTDLEVTLLANLISLTPGTLTIEASDDRSRLFVHSMYVESPEAFRADVAGFAARLYRAVRSRDIPDQSVGRST